MSSSCTMRIELCAIAVFLDRAVLILIVENVATAECSGWFLYDQEQCEKWYEENHSFLSDMDGIGYLSYIAKRRHNLPAHSDREMRYLSPEKVAKFRALDWKLVEISELSGTGRTLN